MRNDQDFIRAYKERIRKLQGSVAGGGQGASKRWRSVQRAGASALLSVGATSDAELLGAAPLLPLGPGGAGAAETAGRVEALLRQIKRLCQERKGLERALEEADQWHRDAVRELRSKLTAAQHGHSEAAQGQARLRGMTASAEQEHRAELELLSRHGADNARRLETEAEKLEASCRLVHSHLDALAAEAHDYQSRVCQLEQEQAAAREVADTATGLWDSSDAELHATQHRLRQSEAERHELEAKFALVGKRFEHAMDVSENEIQETSAAFNEKLKNGKRKVEKAKRRLDEAGHRLERAKQLSARVAAEAGERAAEIQQLRTCLEGERQSALKQEERLIETRRQALEDQANELEKLSGLMPVAVHERIMNEQAAHNRAALHDLEDALQQQLRIQEITEQQHHLMQEDSARQLQAQRAHLEQEQQALQAELEGGLLHDDAQRAWNERIHQYEEELKEANAALAEAKARAAALEERRQATAEALQRDASKLGALKGDLDVGRGNRSRAAAALAEAKEQLAVASRHAVAEASGDEREPTRGDDPAKECLHVEASLAARRQQSAALEPLLAELDQRDGLLKLESGAAKAQGREAERRLEAAQQQLVQLERSRDADARALQRKQELAWKIRYLLEGHVEHFRREQTQLRLKVQEGQRSVREDLQRWQQRWLLAVREKATDDVEERHHAHVEATAATSQVVEALAARLGELRGVAGGLRARVGHATEAAASRKRAADGLHVAVQAASRDAESLMLCVHGALPDGLADSAKEALLDASGVSGQFLSDSPSKRRWCSSSVGSVDVAATLRGEVQRCMKAAEVEAAAAEGQRATALVTRLRAEQEAAERALTARGVEKHEALKAEIEALDAALHGLWESAAGAVNAASEASKHERRAAILSVRLEASEAEALDAERRALAAKHALDNAADEASFAVEDARQDACRPLDEELRQASVDEGALQRRLDAELQRRRGEWAAHRARGDREAEEEQHRADTMLLEDVSRLRRELTQADGENEAVEAQLALAKQLRERHAAAMRSVEEAQSELRVLQARREGNERAAGRHQETVRQTERLLSSVLAAAEHEKRDAEEEEGDLKRRHGEAMQRLRRQRGAAIASLEHSIGSLSADISVDSFMALRAHSELQTSAELLAQRAHAAFASSPRGFLPKGEGVSAT